MKVPQLRKKPEKKSCHNTTWEDDYSWMMSRFLTEIIHMNIGPKQLLRGIIP